MGKLVKLSTYAKMHDVSTECVRKWASIGKVKSVLIDGIRFIETEE